MFFVLLSRLDTSSESLLEYYVRSHGHLIPFGVDIWEYEQTTGQAKCIYLSLIHI